MQYPNKIKILEVTHDLNIGGLQRVVVDLAKNLNKEKFNVTVCALKSGGPLEGELKTAGIKIIKIQHTPGRVDYFSFWKLYKILKTEKPDIIHTHNTHPLIDGTIASLLSGVPVRIHTDHARQFPDKNRYMMIERLFSRFIEKMITVSNHTKGNLVSYEKISPEKIEVIINGIDGRKYCTSVDQWKKKNELGIVEKKKPIIGLGVRLSRQKGIEYLLDAVKLLKEDFPDILLLIAGEGELSEELRLKAERLNITDSVLFLGPRLDMNEILKVLDIYVLPSIWEGLPLVILEAMAASLPIVATDVGGNREVIREGENGFLVRPKDSRALYLAIKKILDSNDLKQSFSINSLTLFQKAFSLDKMVLEYEKVFENYNIKKNGAGLKRVNN